jgi:hypothetical protein
MQGTTPPLGQQPNAAGIAANAAIQELQHNLQKADDKRRALMISKWLAGNTYRSLR